MQSLRFLWRAWNAYRQAGDKGLVYFAVTRRGVPQLAVIIGTGREAWRVSDFAVSRHSGGAPRRELLTEH